MVRLFGNVLIALLFFVNLYRRRIIFQRSLNLSYTSAFTYTFLFMLEIIFCFVPLALGSSRPGGVLSVWRGVNKPSPWDQGPLFFLPSRLPVSGTKLRPLSQNFQLTHTHTSFFLLTTPSTTLFIKGLFTKIHYTDFYKYEGCQ